MLENFVALYTGLALGLSPLAFAYIIDLVVRWRRLRARREREAAYLIARAAMESGEMTAGGILKAKRDR